MTDDDVLTAVSEYLITARESVAGEQLNRPVTDIIGQVRRRRLRRGLLTVAAGVIAVAAALALVPGRGARPAHLTAWTVAAKASGQLVVTIHELRDPAGLQRQLRADGVPATVRFTGQVPRSCLYYPLSSHRSFQLQDEIFPQSSNTSGRTAFTIDPAAIPARIGLWITVSTQPEPHGHGTWFEAGWTLIYASGHCVPGRPEPRTFTGTGVGGSG